MQTNSMIDEGSCSAGPNWTIRINEDETDEFLSMRRIFSSSLLLPFRRLRHSTKWTTLSSVKNLTSYLLSISGMTLFMFKTITLSSTRSSSTWPENEIPQSDQCCSSLTRSIRFLNSSQLECNSQLLYYCRSMTHNVASIALLRQLYKKKKFDRVDNLFRWWFQLNNGASSNCYPF